MPSLFRLCNALAVSRLVYLLSSGTLYRQQGTSTSTTTSGFRRGCPSGGDCLDVSKIAMLALTVCLLGFSRKPRGAYFHPSSSSTPRLVVKDSGVDAALAATTSQARNQPDRSVYTHFCQPNRYHLFGFITAAKYNKLNS